MKRRKACPDLYNKLCADRLKLLHTYYLYYCINHETFFKNAINTVSMQFSILLRYFV
jgi:hypothetical protein